MLVMFSEEYLTAFFRSSTLTFSRPSSAAKHFATRAAYSSALCPCNEKKGSFNRYVIVVQTTESVQYAKAYIHAHPYVRIHLHTCVDTAFCTSYDSTCACTRAHTMVS